MKNALFSEIRGLILVYNYKKTCLAKKKLADYNINTNWDCSSVG